MKVLEKKYLLPFILVTSLFALWGLANNMTDTLLAAFKKITQMSDTQTSFIQMAFYGAYFCVALPAALFIRKYSYKKGVILTGIAALCSRSHTLSACSQYRQLCLLSGSHLYYGIRMLSAGDHGQSLHNEYGKP